MRLHPSILLAVALLFFTGISCTTPGAVPEADAADGKVGYINLNRLVRESEMGKKARADLVALRQQKELEVERKGQTLKLLREEINNRGAQMDANEKKEKVELLQKVYKEYQRLVADAKEDIVREDRELVATILRQADDILKTVAKKKKFSIILKDPNAIGYLDEEVDITDDVLKELNKK